MARAAWPTFISGDSFSAAQSNTYNRDNELFYYDAYTNYREAFKVGDIHISTVSTNPATTLGYGTWTAFGAGRVLVGLDAGQTEFDTVEETGGAKTHALSAAENGIHTHTQDSHNHTQDAHNHTQNAHSHLIGELWHMASGGDGWMAEQLLSTPNASTQNATATNQAATATNQAATATNQNSGSGTAHNNLQPYITVYMWKRTA